MIDYVTTDGELVMSAPEEIVGLHLKGDIIVLSDNRTFVVAQRTWLYERAGIEIVNPLDTNKRTSGVKAKLQIILQEVDVNAMQG